MEASVTRAFDHCPSLLRAPLLQLRALIYDVAATLPETGGITEDLKWGQPSYTTVKKAGSPIRLGVFGDDQIALFFHCQTTLVRSFATVFQDTLEFSGNRAIVLNPTEKLPVEALTFCISQSLTYHLKKA